MIIVGNTVGTTAVGPDYAQTEETNAAFIRNKPDAAIGKAQTTADTAKKTAEEALPRSGGAMTGPLEVQEPAADNHPVTKGYMEQYVNEKRKVFICTLTASGWMGDSAPYTQTVPIDGIRSTDTPHYGVRYDENQELRLQQKEAFALVDDLDTTDGSITVTCFEDKPEVDIPIQMEVMR